MKYLGNIKSPIEGTAGVQGIVQPSLGIRVRDLRREHPVTGASS